MTQESNSSKPSTKSILVIVGFVVICVVLVFIYYFARNPQPTTIEIVWGDFLVVLPYLIVGGVSFGFAFLDIHEKFPDFGLKMPLKTRYGWTHLVFNSITPMLLLYGYLNYFVPVLEIPSIGDVWLTSFVVALAFPMLIRSKFFTFTNPSGDNVSVGFELLYDGLLGFIVEGLMRTSGALQTRRQLLLKCSTLFKKEDVRKEAYMLILNRTDWNEERKENERKSIDDIYGDQRLDDEQKVQYIASYILLKNGEDYLEEIMVGRAPTQAVKQEINKLIVNFKSSRGTLPLL